MRSRTVFVVLAVLVVSGCLGAVSPGASPTETSDADGTSDFGGPSVTVTVAEVVDGDTVKVRYANGSRDTVRLLGVDTPEVYGSNAPGEFEGVPDTEAGVACLDAAGEDASAYARERLSGEEVTLVFDETADRRGYYGRLLAYVSVDGRSFNLALLESGHARVYDSTFTERERYRAAEADARAAGRGLWSCADRTTTGTSADDASIDVVRIHPDAAGDDNENLDDEYVVFRNEGEESVNLTGWSVVDAAGNEYDFPPGTTLEPGAELTLVTGRGTDSRETLYWGRESAVWNNGGDTVELRDGRGVVEAERRY
ncbi:lamin tail domain-containing protein [Halogeometricum limi]|uniref:Micrococcal nuclease n=1 Tax=Halogeometricum limi TaxID=555875 RepID=A0A1I6GHQ3_9EURY|nr:lamin tail domain-containing protein [Halogeometricum limi]SFR41690.1 micrococcal nuclease [Halogeometricum limi]